MDQTNLPSRRGFLGGAAALSLGSALPLPALAQATAQAWPTKPVRVLVPFGAGGIADITVRIGGGAAKFQFDSSVFVRPRHCGSRLWWSLSQMYRYLKLECFQGFPGRWISRCRSMCGLNRVTR